MFRPVVAIIRSLSFDTLKEYVIQLCVGFLNEEISTSRPFFFKSDISILGVWVSHSVNLKV